MSHSSVGGLTLASADGHDAVGAGYARAFYLSVRSRSFVMPWPSMSRDGKAWSPALAGRTAPKVDVRPVSPIFGSAITAPENVDVLQVIIAAEACRTDHSLAIAILKADTSGRGATILCHPRITSPSA